MGWIENSKKEPKKTLTAEKGNKTWYTRFISQVVEIKSHTIKS